MIEAPQVQSVLSSNNISEKDASRLISKFLVEQKKYIEHNETDVAPANNTSEEDYFDMEDDDNCGTFEEVESRLAGIVRSLSGIKKPVEQTLAPATSPETPEVADEDQDMESTADEKAKINQTPVKTEDIALEQATPVTDKKLKKKLEKEAKKSSKKAKKKAEKEAKKSAKKKRKASDGDTQGSAKKVKIEG